MPSNFEIQKEELFEAMSRGNTVVVGWHNGITGMTCMLGETRMNDEYGFDVISYPVVLEGTNLPICFTSCTYDKKDGLKGKVQAFEIAKKQAEWIADKINK